MPNTTANGISIEYDTFGERTSTPLLLIMGLSAQMIDWDEEFCEQLAERDLYVIRFDNRDVGLSTKFEETDVPDIMGLIHGKKVHVPYSLEDMADDAVGLLDSLGLEKAHICGISMGAMITQIIGYSHPSRVLSLISIMGSTGGPGLPPPKPEAMEMLIAPAPKGRDAYIEHYVKVWKVFWGSLRFDEDIIRKRAAASYDRAFYPKGIARQHAAIISANNRKPKLASIKAPALIIHGSEDPLLPVEHGKDTADAIKDADIMIIEGMGHSLLKISWPRVVEAIVAHTRKALC